MPIIDYHCHPQPGEIRENKESEDMGEMWLHGDRYKWQCHLVNVLSVSCINCMALFFVTFLKISSKNFLKCIDN